MRTNLWMGRRRRGLLAAVLFLFLSLLAIPEPSAAQTRQYARFDILTNQYKGVNSITAYTGVPFAAIDAAYVDVWNYSTPQLYLFSGTQYGRYDILTNQYMGTNSIAAGYAGVPFARIDAAYVDIWHYSTPQLYLFSQ